MISKSFKQIFPKFTYPSTQIFSKQFSSSFQNDPHLLEGVRVLDLSRILVGPYSTMFLADMGAEVIRVEPPEGDETRKWGPPFITQDTATYYLSVNRSKRSICVNLKKEEGLQLIYDLAAKSDVLVENFGPGVTKKLKIDYDVISKINPSIVYASVTAYGTEGPWAKKVGFDLVNQAATGLMHITGDPNGPPQRVGVAITDVVSGLTLSNGILAALLKKFRTGKGCKVETSLLESMVSALVNIWSAHLNGGEDPMRTGTSHSSITPAGLYKAKGDRYFAITCTEKQFRGLCEAIEAPEIADDPRFSSNSKRMENRNIINDILQEKFSQFEISDLMQRFDKNRIPGGPVNSIKQLFEEAHIKGMDIVKSVHSKNYGDVKLVRNPLNFDGQHLTDTLQSPQALGESNREVLTSILGLSNEYVDELYKREAIFEKSNIREQKQ